MTINIPKEWGGECTNEEELFNFLCEKKELPRYCKTQAIATEDYTRTEYMFKISDSSLSTLTCIIRHVADHQYAETNYDFTNPDLKEKLKQNIMIVASFMGFWLQKKGYISVYVALCCTTGKYAILNYQIHETQPTYTQYYTHAEYHHIEEWLGIRLLLSEDPTKMTKCEILGTAKNHAVIVSSQKIGQDPYTQKPQHELCVLITADEISQQDFADCLQSRFAMTG